MRYSEALEGAVLLMFTENVARDALKKRSKKLKC